MICQNTSRKAGDGRDVKEADIRGTGLHEDRNLWQGWEGQLEVICFWLVVTYNVILLQCFSCAPALPSCQNPNWTSRVSPLLSLIQDPFLFLFFSTFILCSYIMSQLSVPSLYSFHSSPQLPLSPRLIPPLLKKKKEQAFQGSH